MGHNVNKKLYGQTDYVDLSSIDKPVLTVVIDTEEEFQWHKPHDRNNVSISAISELYKVQDIFDSRGIIPCYVIDYPVACNMDDNETLRKISGDMRCVIGLHLHPWVSPPHSENVNKFNSFPGNLEKELELAKLAALKDEIEKNFNVTINTYKAGRYGVGVHTRDSLAELGIGIDLSPTPGFDYEMDDGPDFSHYTNRPFRFGPQKKQLCIPCTGGLVGWGSKAMPGIYECLNRKPWLSLRAPGIAARAGLVERIRLSPEGFTLGEMKKVTKALLKSGEKVFTLSFHSPTVKVGCTPYVNSESELTDFLARIKSYLDFFADEVGGEFLHPDQINQLL